MDLESLRVLLEVAPVCAECLGWRYGTSARQVEDALDQLSSLTGFRTEEGRCGRCLRERTVHRIG